MRTEALFAALQLSVISPSTDLSRKQLSQKRAALMLTWFGSHNAQITDERISFWVQTDTDAYAQVVEVQLETHNSPNYEEILIEPLAKTWLEEKGQIDHLASRLTKWLLPTHSVNSPQNRKYIVDPDGIGSCDKVRPTSSIISCRTLNPVTEARSSIPRNACTLL